MILDVNSSRLLFPDPRSLVDYFVDSAQISADTGPDDIRRYAPARVKLSAEPEFDKRVAGRFTAAGHSLYLEFFEFIVGANDLLRRFERGVDRAVAG